MSTAFSDLITATTEAGIYALLRAAGNVVGIDYDAMPDNSVVRTMVKSVVAPVINAAVAPIIVNIARGGLLDFAPDGPWLNALGEQVFETERITLTFATTLCTFTNTSDNQYNFANKQMIVQNAVTRKTYWAPAFSLAEASAPGYTATVPVTAFEAGTGSNAGPGDVHFLATTFDGVTVTNPSAAIATDLELKDAYIARCRLAASATSPGGAKQAYAYVALSATRADGTPVGATRVNVDADNTDGEVTVYVADADGSIAGGTEPWTGDLKVIYDALLSKVVPHGVHFIGVFSAVPVSVPVTYSATAISSAGLTPDEIKDLVEAALLALMEVTPIGGWNGVLPISKIRGVIVQVEGTPGRPRPLISVVVSSPSADVALAANEVPILVGPFPTIAFLDDF